MGKLRHEDAMAMIEGINQMARDQDSAAVLTAWSDQARKAEKVVLAHICRLRQFASHRLDGKVTEDCHAMADEANAALNAAMERFAMHYEWYADGEYRGTFPLGFERGRAGGFTRHQCMHDIADAAAMMIAAGSGCPNRRFGCGFVAPEQLRVGR